MKNIPKRIFNKLYEYILNDNQKKIVDVSILIFSKYGYYKSLTKGVPCDTSGNSLPWYSYPAIEYLQRLDFSEKKIFEWGSGYSSLYWSHISKDVTSIEDNKKWFTVMKRKKQDNMKLIFCKNKVDYVSSLSSNRRNFDLIVIDGSYRRECINEAIKYYKAGGMLLLDNSDWYPNTCSKLRNLGFTEISFSGLTCLNNYTVSTSIFFKNKLDFKYKKFNRPIGGIVQSAEENEIV